MRGLAFLMLALVTLGAWASLSAASSAPTSLTVTYWKNGVGTGKSKVTWTLRCNPAGGTLRRPGIACRELAEGGRRLFAPIPSDRVCTEIYGGPQVARVVGEVLGKSVWARFSREDGCEIARWDRLTPWLLPLGELGRSRR